MMITMLTLRPDSVIYVMLEIKSAELFTCFSVSVMTGCHSKEKLLHLSCSVDRYCEVLSSKHIRGNLTFASCHAIRTFEAF